MRLIYSGKHAVTNTMPTTTKESSLDQNATRNSCVVCAAMERLLSVVMFFLLSTGVLYGASAEVITETTYPTIANLLVSMGLLTYAIKAERRLTRVETLLEERTRKGDNAGV